jgi:hypothetical protein
VSVKDHVYVMTSPLFDSILPSAAFLLGLPRPAKSPLEEKVRKDMEQAASQSKREVSLPIDPDFNGSPDRPLAGVSEADVLRRGAIFPGQDVAVLQLKDKGDLVCLRLGDSDLAAAPDGMPVIAFGFPGAAAMAELEVEEKDPQVISHTGNLAARRMTTGKPSWEVLYMTAAISHGDSGGPLLNSSGLVVGLNVAGNQEVSQQNLAVPISLVHRFLADDPDPGLLTEHWEKGQQYYWRKDYRKALAEFEIVQGLRAVPEDRDWWWHLMHHRKMTIMPEPRRIHKNYYVGRLIKVCQDHLRGS